LLAIAQCGVNSILRLIAAQVAATDDRPKSVDAEAFGL